MRHLHIIGIAGTFMASLARLAKNLGFIVTGCDEKIYPPMSTQLQELDIKIIEGFDEDQTKLKPDLYIIGNIAKRGMPIIEKILNENLPFISGPRWLYENLLRDLHVLAVAGTHGKTTTSSMLTWILEYSNIKAGFLIGGVPLNFNVSARLPEKTKYFVIEADEYDTAFFDKRSKFIHYHPKDLIINNLEIDHIDIFKNLDAIKTQMHHLVRVIASNGNIIYNDKDNNIKKVLTMGSWSNLVPFNNRNSFWYKVLKNSCNYLDSFEVFENKKKIGEIYWNLIGEHNRKNALAVIALASKLNISKEQICNALSEFKNNKRRMEIIGIKNNITIFDDFAHHPTAIKATVKSLKDKYPNKRIIAIFEPRSNTMKIGGNKEKLANSLKYADKVFCYSKDIKWDITKQLSSIKDKTNIENDINKLIDNVVKIARPQDNIIIMSNGKFENIHQKIFNKL